VKKATGLGLFGLIALIVSSMVGGGVFSLPQSMAANASAGAIIIAWVITGIGMWFIVQTFRILADAKPELTNGLYAYAEAGFGKFVGFLMSYGYWVCNCLAMVAYDIMILNTVEYFFPAVKQSNNVPAILIGSALIWIVVAVALLGARRASIVNLVATVSKLIPIFIFLVVMIILFRVSTFAAGFWTVGDTSSAGIGTGFNLADVMPQVKSTMMMTLWVFIGIEGAVVISGRARSQKTVRKATIIAFLGTIVIYALTSLLPLGTYSQEQLAAMPSTGSMAAVMLSAVGNWGSVLVNIGIIVSVIGSWLAWMVMLGEMPATAARHGSFPKAFAKENRFHAPYVALLSTAGIIEAFYLLTFVAANPWSLRVTITSVMAMPAYFFCTLYLIKLSFGHSYPQKAHTGRRAAAATGILGAVYGLWLMYAAGLNFLLIACVIYTIGTPIYVTARVRARTRETLVGDIPGDGAASLPVFRRFEKVIFAVLVVCGVVGVVYTVFNWQALI
jgi:arginine:ornithine antiporter/lysine permease